MRNRISLTAIALAAAVAACDRPAPTAATEEQVPVPTPAVSRQAAERAAMDRLARPSRTGTRRSGLPGLHQGRAGPLAGSGAQTPVPEVPRPVGSSGPQPGGPVEWRIGSGGRGRRGRGHSAGALPPGAGAPRRLDRRTRPVSGQRAGGSRGPIAYDVRRSETGAQSRSRLPPLRCWPSCRWRPTSVLTRSVSWRSRRHPRRRRPHPHRPRHRPGCS